MTKVNARSYNWDALTDALVEKGIQSTIIIDQLGYAVQTVCFDEDQERAFRLNPSQKTLEILARGERDHTFFHPSLINTFPVLIEAWENFAKENKKVMVQFQQDWLDCRLSDETRTQLIPDYYLLDQMDSQIYKELKIMDKASSSYVKDIQKVSGFVEDVVKVMTLFSNLKEKHPTFYISGGGNNLNRHYYYEGHQGKLGLAITNEGLEMRDDELSIAIPMKEPFEECVSEFIETVVKRKRLENLYKAPTHHMERNLGGGISEFTFQTIYTMLCKEHDPEEIEIFFARDFNSANHQGISGHRLVKIFDMYFYYENYNSDENVYMSKDEQEIKNYFLSKILNPFV